MDHSVQQCGYDVAFVSETPEYSRCSVCRLVLRDPVLIITCGHKFCSPCFVRLKYHCSSTTVAAMSPEEDAKLCCPIDRNIIDVTKVCKEFGLQRTIGCLKVKCGNLLQGCLWQGELSDLEEHEQQCKHEQAVVETTKDDNVVSSVMWDGLMRRVEQNENLLSMKEKEIAHLKVKWNEKHDEFDVVKRKNVELEARNTSLENEMKEMRKKVLVNEKENVLLGMEMREHQAETENQKQIFKRELEEIKKKICATGMQNVVIDKKVDEMNQQLCEELKELKMGKAGAKVITDVVEPKSALVQAEPAILADFKHYRGASRTYKILPGHRIMFGNHQCTVGVPSAIASTGQKIYFEVACLDGGRMSNAFIGWAGEKYSVSNNHQHSKVYRPHGRSLHLDGNRVKEEYGKWIGRGTDFVVGVAADMVAGEILFSLNGKWLGVAFQPCKHEKLSPILTGKNINLIVNFGKGGNEFQYSPPDATFKPFNIIKGSEEYDEDYDDLPPLTDESDDEKSDDDEDYDIDYISDDSVHYDHHYDPYDHEAAIMLMLGLKTY